MLIQTSTGKFVLLKTGDQQQAGVEHDMYETVTKERGMVLQTIPYVQRNLELLEKFKDVLC